MKLLIFAAYPLVEIGAFIGLVYGIGFWWTLLATFAAVVVGFVMLRRRGARVFAELRTAAEGTGDTARPLADSALLAASTLLLFIPGLVTTLLGILLMLSPVRAAARPLVAAMGTRRVVARMNTFSRAGRPFTVIDGEVVEPGGPTPAPGWRSIN
ncbi:FxsA family protein [Williamsia maris]|uniref:UPF0716 protein FxsA n=1 Tax=Williamsia maris TaxID=72806 RepID=A0ABT1HJV9_9NOCA|nr:FxsA family protein [Williamsia maris]MCP2178227.1 UPF0716 protein FxsA [Williamsia maris]